MRMIRRLSSAHLFLVWTAVSWMGAAEAGEVAREEAAVESVVAEAVEAAKRGDITRLIELHGGGVCFEQRDPASGLTAPEAARLAGRAETVEWFRGRGIDGRVEMPAPDGIAHKMLDGQVGPDGPGIAVLVGRGEEILFRGGYGMADMAKREPATPDTVFRIGSITKQFTSAAVLLLAEDGQVAPGDPVSRFLPEFPRGEQITLHHLMTHTSGLPNHTSKPEFSERVREAIAPGDLIAEIEEDGFEFDPGAGWAYSNSGYFLLGEIVGQAAGEGWGDYLSRKVFGPLEMGRTGVYGSGMGIVGEAVGYAESEGGVAEAPDWDLSWVGGAGAMYSTVEDLFKWNRAIFEDRILTVGARRLAHSPVKLDDEIHMGEIGGYGYGWRIETYRGKKVISHGGGIAGFLSYLAYFPSDELTVVVLSNSSPAVPGTAPEMVFAALADLFLWDSLSPRPSYRRGVEVGPGALGDYVGTYDFKLLGTLRITLDGGKLRARLSSQSEVVLEPQGSDTFFYADGDAEFRFFRDETDGVSEVTLVQAGFRIHADRYTEPEVVEVAPEVLRRYVGDYEMGSAILEVRVGEGGGLTAKVGRQPVFPILPFGESSFFWEAARARIEFEVDPDSGEAVMARHQQGGKVVEAARIVRTRPGGLAVPRG